MLSIMVILLTDMNKPFSRVGLLNTLLVVQGFLVLAFATVLGPIAYGQTVSQAYGVTGDVQKGMIVMLDPKNTKNVQPLTSKNDTAMQGVVVAPNDTAVSLSGDSKATQVYIANNGKFQVLISTQNGAVKKGDLIAISALDGVGMKADFTQTIILGRAVEEFNGKQNVISTTQLKTSSGPKKIDLGLVNVDIGITRNPLAMTVNGPPLPAFFRKSANAIAGKTVSTVRFWISIGVLFLTLFMTANLLYGGVRNSLISIGRNPLAKKSILRGLLQVVALGLIVFVIGLFAIYLLLTL